MTPLFLAIVALGPRACQRPAEPLRFATYNIENFPKSDRQVEGALSLVRSLDVDFVGLQEIIGTQRLEREAKVRLGEQWEFVWVDTSPLASGGRPAQNIGLLYDGALYRASEVRSRGETRLSEGRYRPTLEVLLEPRVSGREPLRVFVVHLKSGSDGRAVRREQLAALGQILEGAGRGGEAIAVMGDFNSTEPEDRRDIERIAARAGLTFATRDLSCSAFWQRGEDCPTSRLDHILVSEAPDRVEAAAACADSCASGDRCPLYRVEISDHCPVLASYGGL